MEVRDARESEEIVLRSEELQDIIGRMPSRFERYGVLVMACIILALLVGSFFFHYPDTLDAQVLITNATPPVNVVARSSGHLAYVNTRNKSVVRAGEVLGVIRTATNYKKDVLSLEERIETWQQGDCPLDSLVSWL